jgi:hypothetical protein
MILNGRSRTGVRSAVLVARIERVPTARIRVERESGNKLSDSLPKSNQLGIEVRHGFLVMTGLCAAPSLWLRLQWCALSPE